MRGRRISEMRLTAREEREAPATAAPGAIPAAAPGTIPSTVPGVIPEAAPKPPAGPMRYVEFSISAVRGAAAPAVAPTDANAKAAK